jgi:tetratricopeptide (TPR) repeat protein
VTLLRAAGDQGGLALARFVQGVIAAEQGDHETAATLLEESRGDYALAGDRPGVTYTLGWLGYTALRRDDRAVARRYLEDAIAHARAEAAGDLPTWLSFLALLDRTEGELAAAAAHLEESLRLLQGREHPAEAARTLEAVAGLLVARGDVRGAAQAARLWGAAGAIRTGTRNGLPAGDRADYDRDTCTACAMLGEAAWAAAIAAGADLPIEQAIDYALEAVRVAPVGSASGRTAGAASVSAP